MTDKSLSLNGTSRDFLERFNKMEQKVENQREDTKDIKSDVKEIKDALVPLANMVYFHHSVIKTVGKILAITVSVGAVILAAVL